MPVTRVAETLDHDPAQSRRKYPCPMCPKSFTRSEHCVRHQRSHTLEKPFSCRYCRRKYARRDLVLRHEKTIHKDEYTKETCRASRNRLSAMAVAPGADDEVAVEESSPSSSSPEALSPQKAASLNGSHHPVPMDTSPAFPATQSYPDTILTDGLTTLNGQHGPRHVPQQFPTDVFAISEQYEIPEKTPQDSGLGCSGSADALTESAFSEGSDERWPYWAVLDIPPLFDVNGGFDFSLGSGLPRSLSRANKESHQMPAFVTGLSPPPEDVLSDPLLVSLPTVVMHDRLRIKPAMFTESMRRNLIFDLLDMGCDADLAAKLPSSTVLQNCVRGYFERFHIHLGLFHPHSMNLSQTASPLILAMCAIGALYRLDRKLSAILFCTAESALVMFSSKRDGDSASPSFEADAAGLSSRHTMDASKPLWELQTKVLLAFIATLGGQSAFSRKAIDDIGFLACEYRILASYLRRDTWQAHVSWHHWIDRESRKRVLYAILMISNILNITYGVPPITSLVQEYDVEIPDDDKLWHASTEIDWTLALQERPRDPLPSLRDAVSQLLYGKASLIVHGLDQWSPYAVTVVMHAVSIHTWNLMQSAQILTGFALNLDGPEAIQSLLTSKIETALARCYLMISNARAANELTWNEAEGPLLFNSLSLLRGIHVRVLTGIGGLDRMVLLSDDKEEVSAAVRDYITQDSRRNTASTKTIHSIFDNIMVILKSDAHLLRKTAAFNWSIEHALVGVDCAIFLSNCIQKIQLAQIGNENINPAELELLQMTRDLLVDIEHSGEEKSLAAGVLRMWKQFYDDVWVWGVTPRIARLFEQLACAYDLQLNSAGDPNLMQMQ